MNFENLEDFIGCDVNIGLVDEPGISYGGHFISYSTQSDNHTILVQDVTRDGEYNLKRMTCSLFEIDKLEKIDACQTKLNKKAKVGKAKSKEEELCQELEGLVTGTLPDDDSLSVEPKYLEEEVVSDWFVEELEELNNVYLFEDVETDFLSKLRECFLIGIYAFGRKISRFNPIKRLAVSVLDLGCVIMKWNVNTLEIIKPMVEDEDITKITANCMDLSDALLNSSHPITLRNAFDILLLDFYLLKEMDSRNCNQPKKNQIKFLRTLEDCIHYYLGLDIESINFVGMDDNQHELLLKLTPVAKNFVKLKCTFLHALYDAQTDMIFKEIKESNDFLLTISNFDECAHLTTRHQAVNNRSYYVLTEPQDISSPQVLQLTEIENLQQLFESIEMDGNFGLAAVALLDRKTYLIIFVDSLQQSFVTEWNMTTFIKFKTFFENETIEKIVFNFVDLNLTLKQSNLPAKINWKYVTDLANLDNYIIKKQVGEFPEWFRPIENCIMEHLKIDKSSFVQRAPTSLQGTLHIYQMKFVNQKSSFLFELNEQLPNIFVRDISDIMAKACIVKAKMPQEQCRNLCRSAVNIDELLFSIATVDATLLVKNYELEAKLMSIGSGKFSEKYYSLNSSCSSSSTLSYHSTSPDAVKSSQSGFGYDLHEHLASKTACGADTVKPKHQFRIRRKLAGVAGQEWNTNGMALQAKPYRG